MGCGHLPAAARAGGRVCEGPVRRVEGVGVADVQADDATEIAAALDVAGHDQTRPFLVEFLAVLGDGEQDLLPEKAGSVSAQARVAR
ncbi:hypothetical protein [Streptomyces himalayensis]|uniref:Uncharacterized protein n=1 Tax=Streptomyces himalayensis subsp. himalayensis TaxID=2756131 RepID=A0A7W0DUF4_9ACTN|nr:hypothetical protein [Streptomyces himalayensis]MBA2950938.1 hypothetical protein [Streptomyces himalayensis subsp. himalayensis]